MIIGGTKKSNVPGCPGNGEKLAPQRLTQAPFPFPVCVMGIGAIPNLFDPEEIPWQQRLWPASLARSFPRSWP